ncbi:MAG: hypothetical protein PHP45_04475 [Elusimicrobiales bacterium]|nr:hypothetical protein [Elusimicrobiales bacterium]
MLSEQFPEIKMSQNPADVPWYDAVTWITHENGVRHYQWVDAANVAYVVWTNGNLSLRPHPDSKLNGVFENIIIQGATVFVGKGVRVG